MRLIILFAYCRQNGENRPILYLFKMLLFLNNIKTPFIFNFGFKVNRHPFLDDFQSHPFFG